MEQLLGFICGRNMSKRHLCIDISGALQHPNDYVGYASYRGKVLESAEEVKMRLLEAQDKGYKFLPVVECDNFDYMKGCLGHGV